MKKTNAIRLVEQAKIPYRTAEYEFDESDLSGVHAARALGMEPERVFKTLVARGDRTGVAVFCIPVAETLSLKKAAKVSGNKKIEMLHMKDLLGVTGYIRGGCSPIGMKKAYPTYIHQTAPDLPEVGISGGARGLQLLLEPQKLIAFTGMEVCDLTE